MLVKSPSIAASQRKDERKSPKPAGHDSVFNIQPRVPSKSRHGEGEKKSSRETQWPLFPPPCHSMKANEREASTLLLASGKLSAAGTLSRSLPEPTVLEYSSRFVKHDVGGGVERSRPGGGCIEASERKARAARCRSCFMGAVRPGPAQRTGWRAHQHRPRNTQNASGGAERQARPRSTWQPGKESRVIPRAA